MSSSMIEKDFINNCSAKALSHANGVRAFYNAVVRRHFSHLLSVYKVKFSRCYCMPYNQSISLSRIFREDGSSNFGENV